MENDNFVILRLGSFNNTFMLSACLYIRVSTDEQAIRGFSQRNQQERLIKFCQSNGIRIVNTVFEDCSAKSFNRPAWNRLIADFQQFIERDMLFKTKELRVFESLSGPSLLGGFIFQKRWGNFTG